MEALKEYEENIKNLLNVTYYQRILDTIRIDENGLIFDQDKLLNACFFINDIDSARKTFNFKHFLFDKKPEGFNILLIKTAFFEHLKTLEKITDSIYLYENPELEYENFAHMKNITKTVFGDVVPNISVIEKIHTNSNGNIESFNTHFIKLSEKNKKLFFRLSYSGNKDIWSDNELRISLQDKIKKLTNIEYELDDIIPDNLIPDNLKEIGEQVRSILY